MRAVVETKSIELHTTKALNEMKQSLVCCNDESCHGTVVHLGWGRKVEWRWFHKTVQILQGPCGPLAWFSCNASLALSFTGHFFFSVIN